MGCNAIKLIERNAKRGEKKQHDDRVTLDAIGLDFYFTQPEATRKLNPHFLLCPDTRRKHRTFYANERNAMREQHSLNEPACDAYEGLGVSIEKDECWLLLSSYNRKKY